MQWPTEHPFWPLRWINTALSRATPYASLQCFYHRHDFPVYCALTTVLRLFTTETSFRESIRHATEKKNEKVRILKIVIRMVGDNGDGISCRG